MVGARGTGQRRRCLRVAECATAETVSLGAMSTAASAGRTKLEARWSPEQIAGWLKRTYPDDPHMHLSHEAIYRSRVQSRGALKQALITHLRRAKTMRRARQATGTVPGRGTIADAVSIRERPATIDDRAIPGHWEGDLLRGGTQSQIATLVERSSPGRDAGSPAQQRNGDGGPGAHPADSYAAPDLAPLPTVDRGHEFAAHRRFTVATNVAVYFCDPRSPWQRGSNENTNGLLRQYFPKGDDVSAITQVTLNRIARELNQRPRKTLGYESPADRLAALVASTV